jgi:hypothetical protein
LLDRYQRRASASINYAARGGVITKPLVIVGREEDTFFQVWLTNFVDCLDEANTISSPQPHRLQGRIGVIKTPAFDAGRWDGSDLFSVPQDPNNRIFCTDRFMEAWRAASLRGALFSRRLFDPEAIVC